MKKLPLFIFLLFSALLSFSQDKKVDSLYQKIRTGATDTIKAKARYALIDHYIHVTNEYTLGIAHCDTLIEFSKQKKFDRMQCRAWVYRAYCDEYLGNYDAAIHSDSMCLLLAKHKGLKKEAANAYQNNPGNNARRFRRALAPGMYHPF
jgi:hypothetical protein